MINLSIGGGYVKNEEGGRYWVDFRYERLPNFCYICGLLGHDEKHCQASPMEQRLGRQYGEWLKAGGSLKNGGEKDKLKMQFEAKKGGSRSRVVDDGAGEEIGDERRSLPTVMEAGGADGGSGSAEMMDAVSLGMMEGCDTSNHRDMDRQIRWDDAAPVASSKGLDRTSREEKKSARTELVGNKVHGNKTSQDVTERGYGPAFKEDEIICPNGPKGRGDLNEDKESGPVIREAEVLSPLRLNGKEGSSEARGS